ncbi:MAG: septum site-determining protein MinC [Gammaproteobacteria bacterium]|nr:septum site-determining protein MinC [Gammaproteobacteria bacterium]
MLNESFRLKGSVLTTFILELCDYDLATLQQQLQLKVEGSPDFFQQSPVIIDLSALNFADNDIDYPEILTICRQNGLQPVAFRHHPQLDLTAIDKTGLAVIQHSGKVSEKPMVTPAQQETAPSEPRIIAKTVRSGQQIYAEGSDLIIMGSVSGGAEVLADGNIHIYGSLRGRALAGVSGNKSARIFCANNEAELVSIAGHFLLSDALQQQPEKRATQFYLLDEALHVVAL